MEYVCTWCKKTYKSTNGVEKHIESLHREGGAMTASCKARTLRTSWGRILGSHSCALKVIEGENYCWRHISLYGKKEKES